jgi:hypothetical protein
VPRSAWKGVRVSSSSSAISSSRAVRASAGSPRLLDVVEAGHAVEAGVRVDQLGLVGRVLKLRSGAWGNAGRVPLGKPDARPLTGWVHLQRAALPLPAASSATAADERRVG